MRLAWSPTAVRHIAEIRRYIARFNPQAAASTAAAIRKAVAGLGDFPGRGRPGRVPDTRELVIPGTPFIVPYSVRGDIVEVHAVLHGARRWPDHLN
jgi:addiction module RelE/StbE family toxin